MPRNFMFTKEEIVQAALDLTRERGASAVTARALGQKLGSSSRPIFSYFSNMSEVQAALLQAAQQLYQRYLAEDMTAGKYPPYKASGMAYIRFAKEEKELFRFLFMRDRTQETKEQTAEELPPLIAILRLTFLSGHIFSVWYESIAVVCVQSVTKSLNFYILTEVSFSSPNNSYFL